MKAQSAMSELSEGNRVENLFADKVRQSASRS